jgi:hypothetical protein
MGKMVFELKLSRVDQHGSRRLNPSWKKFVLDDSDRTSIFPTKAHLAKYNARYCRPPDDQHMTLRFENEEDKIMWVLTYGEP